MIQNPIMLGLSVAIALVIIFGPVVWELIKSHRKVKELTGDLAVLLSQKKSSEVRLGQITEQLTPFLEKFKYNPKKARFIGMPIDYIVFEDNKIIFIEVKSGKSKMSKNQNAIKKLIESGKVEFETIQIK